MTKYEELSKVILENVGGIENITAVNHCATRLRINYKDKNLVKEETLKNIPGSSGLVNKLGQLQFIIGPNVNDAYNTFLSVSGWNQREGQENETNVETGPKNVGYWLNKFGNTVAPIFMPIIPALIVGGMIGSIKNLLVNYFGMSVDSGTAQFMINLFQSAFQFLPIYIGYTLAKQLKMQPIMGAYLGAIMVGPMFESGLVTDFMGIAIPQVSYRSTVLPVILGVILMYWVDKGLKKIIPEFLTYFVKPLLTIIIVTPITFIALGPLGNMLSGYIASFALWMLDTLGIFAMPILAVVSPYFTMFGLDKGLQPIGLELINQIGYDPFTRVMGFISNICVGATTLALALTVKEKNEKGVMISAGVTAICGVTEPAFYGSLISRPRLLLGTAIGAATAGLFAGIVGLKTFVMGGCPGMLTLLFFVDQNGSIHYMVLALITAAIAIAASFIATTVIIKLENRNKNK